MIDLVRPDATLHRQWLDLIADYDRPGLDGGSIADDEIAAMSDPDAFAAWVRRLLDHEAGRHVPEERVPCTSRWGLRDGQIVGVVSLRHELNDLLLEWGGHIGYAVRVSARRQGVASRMLRLILDEATHLGINPVLVTCDEDNLGSQRTIERSGGVYEDSREGKRRYWITQDQVPIGYAVRPLSCEPLWGRLVELRPVTEALAAAVKAGEKQTDWAPDFPREDDLVALALHGIDGTPSQVWGSRLIVRRADRTVVGTLGFYGPPGERGGVEIGYGLVGSARGKGLITDALRLAVPAAEAAGTWVQAHAATGNLASERALLRAGFTPTGEVNHSGERRFVRPGAPETETA